MERKRFLPAVDKYYWFIVVVTLVLLAAATVIASYALVALLILIATDILTVYFLFSPFFGYVELRESTVCIKFGCFSHREIEYRHIRALEIERKFYSESMTSLKCAYEHVNIKFNSFDVLTVSVRDNAALVAELEARRRSAD